MIQKTTFPTLYKKTSTGAIQFWQIEVQPCCNGLCDPADIITNYGQVGTDSPQTTIDTISEGKNTGKKNATTPLQQALKEAQSKWERQKKKGYVDTQALAQEGATDDLIEGGINPMLAHKFEDHAAKIALPCFAQAKLDGIRCIAIVKDKKVTLWTRTRKRITSMPHIEAEILDISKGRNSIFDGELYNHDFKNNFEHIVSLVRQEEPDPRHTDVEYHIYDLPSSDKDFIQRNVDLEAIFDMSDTRYCKLVDTLPVDSEQEGVRLLGVMRELGYEGVMLRNFKGKYENKRSYNLQKVKEFDDAEFRIIGIEEGRGKLQGHVGAFVCTTDGGKEFLAKMSGETTKLKEYFENHALWTGKKLTVKYQGLTGKEGVPRFPVGVIIRDYE